MSEQTEQQCTLISNSAQINVFVCSRLPEKLKVDWPDRNPWPQNAIRPAGTVLGKMSVHKYDHVKNVRRPNVTLNVLCFHFHRAFQNRNS